MDVAVIGAGPAGLAAAIRARELGAKTVLVARAEVGGKSGATFCTAEKIASRHLRGSEPQWPAFFSAAAARRAFILRRLNPIGR
jgi:flavin-dependent dehydrogenase